MRTTIQRLFGLALGLALVFGSVGIVSAEDAPTQPGEVNLSANVVGYLELSIENGNVPFGAIDAYGLGDYAEPVNACLPATEDNGGAIYGYFNPTVLTIISSTDYNLSVTGVDGTNPNRFFVSTSNACDLGATPLTNIGGYTAGGDRTLGGDPYSYWFNAQVFVGDEDLDARASFVFTGEAI